MAKQIEKYTQYLSKLKKANLYRTLSSCQPKAHIDLTKNDYLCLSHHPLVLEKAILFGEKYGTGGKASRLLCHLPIYEALESKIAQSKNAESCLTFSSGFQANANILEVLLNANILKESPLVFSDRLNHASIHQGCKLAGAKEIRYKNKDLDHLSKLLDKFSRMQNPKFIISEAVFSMDGTCVDIESLMSLASHYNAFLYLDEAHSLGLFGKQGYGLLSYSNFSMSMGTFSKSVGASGGYVICNNNIKNILINKCKGFIYSTAPSPMIIGAIDAAWDLIPKMEKERKQILQYADLLVCALKELDFDIGNSQSHIIPIIIGNPLEATQLKSYLAAYGILVSCILPPTVQYGKARIRLSLNASHTHSNLEELITRLNQWKKKQS